MRTTADAQLDAAAEALAQPLTSGKPAQKSARALIRLALDFRTWEMLADGSLSDAEMAQLFVGAVSAIAHASSGQSRQAPPAGTLGGGFTAAYQPPTFDTGRRLVTDIGEALERLKRS